MADSSPRIRNGISVLPENGKISISCPEIAVRLVEADPVFGMRVFTMPGLPDDTIYVLDIDALNEALRV